MARDVNYDGTATSLFINFTEPIAEIVVGITVGKKFGDAVMPMKYIRYLREKAAQLRRVAQSDPSTLARRLLALADEFDAKAAEIEAGEARNAKPC